MDTTLTLAMLALGSVAMLPLVGRVRRRLELSRAKHPSLTGHVRIAKRIAGWIPYYGYDEAAFFRSDGAPPEVARRRHDAFFRLASLYRERYPRTLAQTLAVKASLSDLQMTSQYRVPFQYRELVGRHLTTGSFLESSTGVTVTDLDGNQFYDVAGSYGVNVFGHDFYKECIARGAARVAALGPVLGAFHPVMDYNIRRLREISGHDEVSFHMSGTEAVMQAVRLARYHTGRTHLVRFCGAYHGWWDDVQPGIGNPLPARRTYTLREMSEATLRVLERRRDIACVLVNPVQAMHPNAAAPADSALLASDRSARFDRQAYAQWLARLRDVCTRRGIVLILDEVFVGFRIAPRGAQEYFGVQADLVTYGKTLAGGLPIGVVCGRADLMRRFREDRPGDLCFARGTFNSHPYVMGAMHEFLQRLEAPAMQRLYDGLDATWDARAARLNARLEHDKLPVRVANLSSIWTVCYTVPSRYNWMFQYYLRGAGLALAWIGTGRLVFSLNYTDADFEAVADRFVTAARSMLEDGWWWSDPDLTNRGIRRRVLEETLAAFAPLFAPKRPRVEIQPAAAFDTPNRITAK